MTLLRCTALRGSTTKLLAALGDCLSVAALSRQYRSSSVHYHRHAAAVQYKVCPAGTSNFLNPLLPHIVVLQQYSAIPFYSFAGPSYHDLLLQYSVATVLQYPKEIGHG